MRSYTRDDLIDAWKEGYAQGRDDPFTEEGPSGYGAYHAAAEACADKIAAPLRQQAGRVGEDALLATAQAMREEAENGSNAFRDMMHGYADSIEAALAQNKQGEAELTDERIEEIVRRNGGKWDGDRWVIEDADLHPIARTLHAERARVPDVDAMVSRFLGWTLPKDFAPDAGISFKPIPNPHGDPYPWPTGTNLLHAGQAKAMFEYVLAAAPAQRAEVKP